MSKKGYILVITVLLISSLNSIGSIPITITDNTVNELHYWKGQNLVIMEDENNTITIDDILTHKYDNLFKDDKAVVPFTKNNNASYWAKISIKNTHKDNFQWIFEVFDQAIDFVEFYYPDENGNYVKSEGGDNKPWSVRQYKHKNYVFNINLPHNQEQIFYLKVKSAHKGSFIGSIRNVQSFTGYALKEYFYLALFYGLALSMIIFNLMQYFVTNSKIYLVYVAYIIAAAMYSATQDGLGYHFIWNDFPELNNPFYYFTSLLVICLFLLLAYEFLKEAKPKKIYIQIGLFIIGLRILAEFLNFLDITIIPIFLFDTFIRISIFVFSFILLYKGQRQLRFFTIAMFTLVMGYTIRDLTINGLFPNTIATVYMHLIGESLQMLFISLALSERIKIKMQDLVISQEKSLLELEETHRTSDTMRLELQKKVEEQIAREQFVSGGISDLSSIITNYLNDTNQLYKRIAKFIAEYFECRLTALYLVDKSKNCLVLTTGYGLDESRLNGVEIQEREGLLGQCMVDKERIELRSIPEGYITINSGLGNATPTYVLIEPLHFNKQLVGIIEMAAFKEFTPLQYEVLDKFTSQIASTLSNVMFNDTTRKMLEESVDKEEMLRQQEEEMRQQVEELIATQEEYARKEQEYVKEIEELRKKKG